MPKRIDIFVSTVIVADQESENLVERIKKVADILRVSYTNYEIVLIDNGLDSAEFTGLKKLLTKVGCIRIIRFSKQYDTDTAIFAGIEAAIGDFVCTFYNHDPIELIPSFVDKLRDHEIVFGVARNLKRGGLVEKLGAKLFYWYSKRYQKIDIPNGSTYFIGLNRTAANAITRSGRHRRHIRHAAKQVGFMTTNLTYELPIQERYSKISFSTLFSRAIDLVSSYSNHPLRALTYFGVVAGLLNIVYAVYVLIINLSTDNVERGWTSLSLQASAMFFILFIILAVLAEYIGKILIETQHEPPYHIVSELSSTVSIADETRRNISK